MQLAAIMPTVWSYTQAEVALAPTVVPSPSKKEFTGGFCRYGPGGSVVVHGGVVVNVDPGIGALHAAGLAEQGRPAGFLGTGELRVGALVLDLGQLELAADRLQLGGELRGLGGLRGVGELRDHDRGEDAEDDHDDQDLDEGETSGPCTCGTTLRSFSWERCPRNSFSCRTNSGPANDAGDTRPGRAAPPTAGGRRINWLLRRRLFIGRPPPRLERGSEPPAGGRRHSNQSPPRGGKPVA